MRHSRAFKAALGTGIILAALASSLALAATSAEQTVTLNVQGTRSIELSRVGGGSVDPTGDIQKGADWATVGTSSYNLMVVTDYSDAVSVQCSGAFGCGALGIDGVGLRVVGSGPSPVDTKVITDSPTLWYLVDGSSGGATSNTPFTVEAQAGTSTASGEHKYSLLYSVGAYVP